MIFDVVLIGAEKGTNFAGGKIFVRGIARTTGV
jgi:hypothetical protein